MSDLHEKIAAAIPEIPHAWLRDRRWFSSKGRDVASITVTDWGALPIDQPGIMALALVRYTTGRPEHYVLPLIAGPDEQPHGVRTPPALTLHENNTTLYAHDAFQFAAFQRLLMQRLIAGDTLALNGGTIVFTPEAALHEDPPPLRDVKLVTAEQSNTSIIYDRQAILKVFRRVVAGINPDVEVSRFLSRAGFEHTPAMLGSISYVASDGVEHSLGLLQGFVPNEGDAWEHTLAQLAQFFAAVPETTDDLAPTTQRLAADHLGEIRQLGALTGEMHRTLASDPRDPDFTPRPVTSGQVSRWQEAIREQRDAILPELEKRAADLPAAQRSNVQELLSARDRIEQRIVSLRDLERADVVLTRYHGDYHLGQVLVSDRGFLILDFEGEPLRSLDERRARSSPLKDVAGMLRSLSYAASSALFAAQEAMPKPSLHAYAQAWEAQARTAFLDGYLAATRGAPFVPRDQDRLHTALAVFELEKALYELNYELNNRPDWLPIPLRGILRAL